MTSFVKKNIVLVFLMGSILASFGFGLFVGKNQVACSVCPPEEVDFSLFWETWAKIQEKFVNPEKIDTQEMIYGAISGMVKSLDDPYTIFLDPEDAKRFEEDVKGKFEGVGMEIGIREEQLTVIAPLEGTPAQKAGLRAGDRVIKVGDTYTRDVTIDEAVNLIRGPKGTEVVLTIYREEWEETKEIKIVRGVIEIPSLEWELKEGDIAYIKLYQFSEKANVDFRKAAVEILDSKADRIILDLRNNPGGYLEVAQDIAGWFVERGEVVVIEDFGQGKEKKEYKAGGNPKFLEYPVVVLINQGSASGSEILAGALRDNRGIKIIGEQSFGKGSVQELEKLQGGSSLKITVAKWLTPNGQLITDIGLEPDIIVEITKEDYDKELDPQLDKAIEIIKDL
ncbi:S41 family peptidase [Patescibacteria group bacterium]|nr:S41 family peptidase [Patescibacteria group bacterium]